MGSRKVVLGLGSTWSMGNAPKPLPLPRRRQSEGSPRPDQDSSSLGNLGGIPEGLGERWGISNDGVTPFPFLSILWWGKFSGLAHRSMCKKGGRAESFVLASPRLSRSIRSVFPPHHLWGLLIGCLTTKSY